MSETPEQVYLPKQRELLRLWQTNKLRRINILVGSVRSGKTWISLVLWAFWVATQPKTSQYLMVGKTLTNLKRNCLLLLQTLVGEKNFMFSVPNKEAKLFGRTIFLEGANDVRSESKIRGATLRGVYIDEITMVPEDFFAMCLSRLSEDDAKLFGTTNPDVPRHWLKVTYIDREDELNILVMNFLLDENIYLGKNFAEDLKKEYVGVYYDRFILGLWVAAEGAIYRIFSENKAHYRVQLFDEEGKPTDLKKRITEIKVGLDIGGTRSNHALTATALTSQLEIVALKSQKIKAEGTETKDIVKAVVDFVNEIEKKYGYVGKIRVDSAESVIIRTIKNAMSNYNIKPSIKREINYRIRAVLALMGANRFYYVADDCQSLEKALDESVWDPKTITDSRLDDGSTDIDSLDSFEYSLEEDLPQLVKVV